MLQIVTKTLNQAELVILQCTFYELFVEYDLRSKKKLVLCLQRVVETRVKVWENERRCRNTSRYGRVFPHLFRVLSSFQY